MEAVDKHNREAKSPPQEELSQSQETVRFLTMGLALGIYLIPLTNLSSLTLPRPVISQKCVPYCRGLSSELLLEFLIFSGYLPCVPGVCVNKLVLLINLLLKGPDRDQMGGRNIFPLSHWCPPLLQSHGLGVHPAVLRVVVCSSELSPWGCPTSWVPVAIWEVLNSWLDWEKRPMHIIWRNCWKYSKWHIHENKKSNNGRMNK